MEGLIAVTYRCNAHCHMCDTWRHPSEPERELSARDLETLPTLSFANITGGEPFLRSDLAEIVDVVRAKADRVVISTNGFFTERVVELASTRRDLGFRVSLEGLPSANDELRGIENGFDHGLRTLLQLKALGIKDLGFGITLSDRNAGDLMELYDLAESMGFEFASAAMHNTYYFHKFDNTFVDPETVARSIEGLSARLIKTNRPKNWFRAWFNMGLANYVRGGERLLPCGVARDVFFVDPFARVMPCNGMDEPMGSLREATFDEIWTSERADEVRRMVGQCDRRCWMIGSVSPAMKKQIQVPAAWVARAKLTGQLPPVTPQ